MRSDEQIRADVVAALQDNSCVGESNIAVMVSRGSVTLMGSVASATAKHHAGYEALFVRGVRNVSNRLEVLFPNVTVVSKDMEVQQAVKNILSWHQDISACDIHVCVEAGVASLCGTVPNVKQRDKVVNLVTRVNGVVAVDNRLHVVDAETEKDG